MNKPVSGNGKLDPTILVIFGITGDLANRKVLPAIYHLLKANLLPEHMTFVGTSRREVNVEDMVSELEKSISDSGETYDPGIMDIFRHKLRMVKLDPVDAADYAHLKTELDEIEDEHKVCMNRLFYLSIPPQVYAPVIRHLGGEGLNSGCQHHEAISRLLVEKPFGYDLTSAKELISTTNQQFKEEQVFRIDHYLAKETAQNILAFRRFNPVFRHLWDHEHISHIEILAEEKIGIEDRAEFYERVGAMRDLVQSHLMQLLALTTMNLPDDIADSNAVHKAKQELLDDIPPEAAESLVGKVFRGQYEGYKDEVKNPNSTTETFVSIPLTIANERWQNTTIRLTTGKAMAEKLTEIRLTFTGHHDSDYTNQLTFRLQPNEGIDFGLLVKKPGFSFDIQPAKMDFSYESSFHGDVNPDAYERVLIDALRGDHTLFATSAEVLSSWRILQPILDYWQNHTNDIWIYPRGSGVPSLQTNTEMVH